MKRRVTRRGFISGSAAGISIAMVPSLSSASMSRSGASRPLVLAAGTTSSVAGTANRLRVTEQAMKLLKDGADTLDAVISAVNIVEDDPRDMSVGYGGLPNEEGDVELDACVMHGPSKRAGAVGALKHIKNPSKVARLVMERTDHVLLVGDGALRFALAHGFKKEDLLTEDARRIWLRWKETMSDRDAWGPGLAAPEKQASSFVTDQNGDDSFVASADAIIANPPTGTISCLAIDERGNMSGTTTTSGLAFKIPGRVGDSPIIGSGLFVDNEIGLAGSTGRGDECLKISGSHTVVELMRRGLSPVDACLEAVKRVVKNYADNPNKLKKFSLIFYAINKNGDYGAGGLWGHWRIEDQLRRLQYVVHDGRENRLHDIAFLYESPEK